MKTTQIKLYKYYNFLFWHYVVLGMSPREIGRLCNVMEYQIRYQLNKHNIPLRTFGETYEHKYNKQLNDTQYKDKEWLQKQYIDLKKGTPEIAMVCNVHACTIDYWLKKHGISKRSQSEATKIAMNKPGFVLPQKKEDWNDLTYVQKHVRIQKELTRIGIERLKICPICNKQNNGKRKCDLMNIDHKYGEKLLDYYYICKKCHGIYHNLVGLSTGYIKHKNIKLSFNFIGALLELQTRTTREQLLKEVISKCL